MVLQRSSGTSSKSGCLSLLNERIIEQIEQRKNNVMRARDAATERREYKTRHSFFAV